MARRQLFHAGQDAVRIGNIAPGQIGIYRLMVHASPQKGVRQQAFEFRSEGKAAVGKACHVQWLHAKSVAGKQQLALVEIVKSKSEHAIEAGKAINAPPLPRGKNYLGIARSAELRPALFKFAAQFAEIVDFAVENDHRAPVRRMHWLRRSLKIDDREAAMAQPYPGIRPHSCPVRASVDHGIAHALNPDRIDRLGRFSMKDTGDPAHDGCGG